MRKMTLDERQSKFLQFQSRDLLHNFAYRIHENQDSFASVLILLNGGITSFLGIIMSNQEDLNIVSIILFTICANIHFLSIHYCVKYIFGGFNQKQFIYKIYSADFHNILLNDKVSLDELFQEYHKTHNKKVKYAKKSYYFLVTGFILSSILIGTINLL